MGHATRRSPVRIAGWSLRAAFAAIIGLFALLNALGVVETGRAQTDTRQIVENMLTSIELVAAVRHDLNEERRLIDAHIFEKGELDMQRLDADIADVDADFAETTRAYEPIATFPEERTTWEDVKTTIAGMRGPITHVLELSRQNRDGEARAAAVGLERRFDDLDRKTTRLIEVNRREADLLVTRIQANQQTSLLLFVALTLGGTTLAFALSVGVSRAIRRREAEVVFATERLAAQNRELDAFAGRVAHDLRGPLTVIGFAATRLAQRAPGEEGTSAVLRRGVSRMDALIQDLLTLSRAEAEVADAACDPSAAGAWIADELGSRAEEAGGVLVVDVAPATVGCGEGLLRQALWNLVDNAVKYRREDVAPHVAVHGTRKNGVYELSVADNGVGMSEEDARHVFEPFHRATRSRDRPGTGLGLSIVKRIVEACGGGVSIKSRLDYGTTFTIHLPLTPNPRNEAILPPQSSPH
jgi:signal transduction histidine kinase